MAGVRTTSSRPCQTTNSAFRYKGSMNQQKQRVVVVGASPKADRYSNKALRLLVEHGHDVIPVNSKESLIEGIPVVRRMEEITDHVDTVTLYVSAETSTALGGAILLLMPDRVIFNPGAENPVLRETFNNQVNQKVFHAQAAYCSKRFEYPLLGEGIHPSSRL
jgi:predicted CoA-binding protein